MSGFGVIPRWLVTEGIIAGLSLSELRVLVVIAGYANGNDWKAFPSVETIATLAGRSVRTVQRTVQSLVNRGVLRVQPGGGRGRSNVYFLAKNPVTQGDTVSGGESASSKLSPIGQGNPVNTESKPGQTEPERVSNRRLNPVSQGVTPTTEQHQQPNNRGAVRLQQAHEGRNGTQRPAARLGAGKRT